MNNAANIVDDWWSLQYLMIFQFVVLVVIPAQSGIQKMICYFYTAI